MEANKTNTADVATFGGGCYWCAEAVFQQVEGVISVTSGFMGGPVKNPSYEQVCSGRTGHAEVVQVRYDPARVTYEQLLEWFWKSHDPTQLNRQGNDIGTQYRSVIFYQNEAQRQAAEASRVALDKSGTFSGPVVTEISPASEFYSAEGYHQDYYRQNRGAPYCQYVIRPKLKKLGLKE
jgi:peptide-methionine (S)-S-oxide reductase